MNTLQVGTKPGVVVTGDRGVTFGSTAPVSARIPAVVGAAQYRVKWFSMTPVGVGSRVTHDGQPLSVTACLPGTAKCMDALDVVNFGREIPGWNIEGEGTR